MKLLFTCILVAMAKNFIVCIRYDNKLKSSVVVCHEKFTVKTTKNYTDYPRCLIEKNTTLTTPR